MLKISKKENSKLNFCKQIFLKDIFIFSLMVTVDCKDFMKFMTYSEEFPLPKSNPEWVRSVMQRKSGSCVVIKDLREGYIIGELNSKKSNHISYLVIVDGQERQLLYSNLDKLFIPRPC